MPRKGYKFHYIYKTTCLKTNKFYIGMHSTFNMDDNYIGSGKHLWHSIKKYGKENHKKEILEFCTDRNKLKQREEEIVNENLLKNKQCMNLKSGGQGGWSIEHQRKNAFIVNKKIKEIYSLMPEWVEKRRKNLCAALYQRKQNGEKIGFQKNPYNWSNKHHSEETKKKIGLKNSENHKGEKNSQFGSCWITNGKENKKIRKNDIIPENWKLGRKINMGQ